MVGSSNDDLFPAWKQGKRETFEEIVNPFRHLKKLCGRRLTRWSYGLKTINPCPGCGTWM